MRGLLRWSLLTCLLLLMVPAVALASRAVSAPTLVLPWQQLWPLVIGALVPVATYVLNHYAPWASEPVKALVLVVVAAASTALYTALATNVIGLNAATLQIVLTGVVAALVAHKVLWLPSGVSTLLGGGSNRPRPVAPAPAPAPAAPVSPPAV